MSQPFEDLPTTPTAEEVLDAAYSRAARAGRAKTGRDAQASMLPTATSLVADNVAHVVTSWPDFDAIDPFYRDLADAVAGRALALSDDQNGGVDALRQHLSSVGWAARQTRDIRSEYQGRIRSAPDDGKGLREQAFARVADVVDQVADDLAALSTARDALRALPEIRPDEPAIVVAGYPNVGKSTFVNAVTNARTETASYPFTTTTIRVGHAERDRLRYQLVDTPGLLDRPADERNEIESQAVTALANLADVVLLVVDPSGECGYPIDVQLALRDAVADRFEAPLLTVATKADRSTDVDADAYTSVTAEDVAAVDAASDRSIVRPEAVLDLAVDAADYEPELPYEG
jgi:nucleolar GTP-binding protein